MRRLLPWILLSLLLAAPAQAASGVASTEPTAESPTDRESWLRRIRDARDQLGAARERYDQAVQAYGKMRHRRKARGAEKSAILDERAASSAALDAAEEDLHALLEEARRAGVPPGWIRDALEGEEGAGPADRAD